MRKFNIQLFTVDPKTSKNADFAKVVSKDFALQFEKGIDTLMSMIGVARKEEVKAGEDIKAYTVTGTLESGVVAEGEVIPLSKYSTAYTTVGTAVLKKWRKVTTAEAISKKGFKQAVSDTNAKMLRQIQDGIRTDYTTFLGTGGATASGAGFQAAMAAGWGKLKVLFEDTAIESVYWVNPMDVATYLGGAQITTQTAFGMTYIENFIGLGTVILDSNVPQGTYYATAKENVVLYYIPANSGDMADAFDLIADETGLIGVHNGAVHNSASYETVAYSGVGLFAENLGGVVVGTISAA